MKKTFLFFVCSVVMTGAAMAQHAKEQTADKVVTTDNISADKKAKAAAEDLDKLLSLSKEQKERVLRICKHLVQLEADMQATGKTPEQYGPELSTVRMQLLYPELTETQYRKLKIAMSK